MENKNEGANVEKRAEMRPVGDLELMAIMVEKFGSCRYRELMGWAVRWSLIGEVEDANEARRRLIEQGMGRSSVR